MKKPKNIAVIIITALIISNSYSQFNGSPLKFNDRVQVSLIGNGTVKSSFLTQFPDNNFSHSKYFSGKLSPEKELLFASSRIDSSNDDYEPSETKSNPRSKSVLLGIALSAVLPGAGEFYAKDYIKSAIFLGIEIAAWTTYAIYQHKGNTQTATFQNYANQYWNVRTYAQWLINMGFPGNSVINPNEPNLETLRSEINSCESQNFSHTLPDYGTQQFYELIGKYQNFQAGWTNLSNIPNNDPNSPYYYEKYHDPIFVNYAYNRQQANNYFNDATTVSWIVLLNHILSAGDAAWSVVTFNKKLDIQTGFRIGTYLSPVTYKVETQPVFNMQVNF
ncbi:MAG: hypothetical protein ACHQJ4_07420 [Ignavibacteria bacterium]